MAAENDDRTQRYDWNLGSEAETEEHRGSVVRGPEPTHSSHRQEATTDEIDPVPPTQRMPVADSSRTGESPTRAYDFGGTSEPETRVLPQQQAPQHTAQASRPFGGSDEPTRAYAPEPVPDQRRQAPAATPLPAPREWQDEQYGPGGGARFASIFIALIGALCAVTPGLLQSMSVSTGQTNLLQQWLGSFGPWGSLVSVGILIVAWAIVAVSLSLSGLGAGLIGGVITLFSVGTFALYAVATAMSGSPWEWVLTLMSAASQLVMPGLALLFAGIAAHFARRGGFKRAVRLARGQRY